ncbi:GNAT family N-acetyltransferase [Ruegeria arenilitoris]|uniref:GNAT family N-acetyltransferase n=1 Tax=Ruegeria arenilitoris TaxID=1173585 RepID=UPI0014817849|nr:hypothetical protein [Ruegeria arenilitoris]
MKLVKKGKTQLILGAAQRGPGALARQVWLALMDSFVRKRHLVFRLDAGSREGGPKAGKNAAQVREILSPGDFPQDALALLNDPEAAHDWGAMGWLEAGWRLWVLEKDGHVQALAWVRDAAHSRDFFVPLNEYEELFWHIYVLPQYRGRNLQGQLWKAIVADRMADGVQGFFTNCRDYNVPSKLNIQKVGFVPVGHCDEGRLTRRRVWRSY